MRPSGSSHSFLEVVKVGNGLIPSGMKISDMLKEWWCNLWIRFRVSTQGGRQHGGVNDGRNLSDSEATKANEKFNKKL